MILSKDVLKIFELISSFPDLIDFLKAEVSVLCHFVSKYINEQGLMSSFNIETSFLSDLHLYYCFLNWNCLAVCPIGSI